MTSNLYRLRTITPLHMGSGRGVGEIDLPVVREKSTGLPVAPGSGVKGVLRDAMDPAGSGACKSSSGEEWIDLFGPAYSDAADQAGMVSFDDAYLLAMPVRSLKGTCAWVTCPFALVRYGEALGSAASLPGIPQLRQTGIAAGTALLHNSVAILEELDLQNEPSHTSLRDQWAGRVAEAFLPKPGEDAKHHGAGNCFRELFTQRFAIVADEAFAFFADYATDIRARIRLGAGRVVADTGLWYEENLPADTLMFGEWSVQRVRKAKLQPADAAGRIRSQVLQIGGKATVGRGRVDFLV